jgi:hypothetical protein
MVASIPSSTPQLLPPGAPLPLPVRLFLRLWTGPIASHLKSSTQTRAYYEGVAGKLVALIARVPAGKRHIKVLVDPINGLEDSSRYWSLNDLMEHVLIVHRQVEDVILKLASGIVPQGTASTAAVKPRGTDRDLLEEFSDYEPGLLAQLDDKVRNLNFNSALTFRHPWMGLLTARQWYWILSVHQAVHYKQAKEIVAGLGC